MSGRRGRSKGKRPMEEAPEEEQPRGGPPPEFMQFMGQFMNSFQGMVQQ